MTTKSGRTKQEHFAETGRMGNLLEILLKTLSLAAGTKAEGLPMLLLFVEKNSRPKTKAVRNTGE